MLRILFYVRLFFIFLSISFIFFIHAFVFQPQCLDTLSLKGMLVYMWGLSHIGKIGS
jgi:hypothetical protein